MQGPIGTGPAGPGPTPSVGYAGYTSAPFHMGIQGPGSGMPFFGATGPQGPQGGSMQRSFPGQAPAVVSETEVGSGKTLVFKANSSIFVDGSIRIAPKVVAALREGGSDAFLATMQVWEIYEIPSTGLPGFEKDVGDALERAKATVPDELQKLIREAARASMRMSAVLMAEIHLDYLREEDFAEAWRAAHVLHVMDT